MTASDPSSSSPAQTPNYSDFEIPDGVVIGMPWPHTIVTWPGGKSRAATKVEHDLWKLAAECASLREEVEQLRQSARLYEVDVNNYSTAVRSLREENERLKAHGEAVTRGINQLWKELEQAGFVPCNNGWGDESRKALRELSALRSEVATLKEALAKKMEVIRIREGQLSSVSEALNAFESKERGIPQATIAASLVAELRRALTGAQGGAT